MIQRGKGRLGFFCFPGVVKSDYQRREEKKVKNKKKLISETPYQSCDILCEPHCCRESERGKARGDQSRRLDVRLCGREADWLMGSSPSLSRSLVLVLVSSSSHTSHDFFFSPPSLPYIALQTPRPPPQSLPT